MNERPLFFEIIAVPHEANRGCYSLGVCDNFDEAHHFAVGELALNAGLDAVNIMQSGHYVGCVTREVLA